MTVTHRISVCLMRKASIVRPMRPINKDIFRLAVPSILANITVPLVGMVDIAVAGHLDTNAATMIGGIAIGSMLFGQNTWNGQFEYIFIDCAHRPSDTCLPHQACRDKMNNGHN